MIACEFIGGPLCGRVEMRDKAPMQLEFQKINNFDMARHEYEIVDEIDVVSVVYRREITDHHDYPIKYFYRGERK